MGFSSTRRDVLDDLVTLHNFRNQFLPNALREFFRHIHAPEERGEYLETLITKFSHRFCACNPDLMRELGLSPGKQKELWFSESLCVSVHIWLMLLLTINTQAASKIFVEVHIWLGRVFHLCWIFRHHPVWAEKKKKEKKCTDYFLKTNWEVLRDKHDIFPSIFLCLHSVLSLNSLLQRLTHLTFCPVDSTRELREFGASLKLISISNWLLGSQFSAMGLLLKIFKDKL